MAAPLHPQRDLRDVEADIRAALDIARALATAGIPVFVAPACAGPVCSSYCVRKTGGVGNALGCHLPPEWENTVADPSAVDVWRPGMALCAVMGCGLDLVDFDPRNGGDPAALNGTMPTTYGAATSPSAGLHAFIRSLGVHSKNSILPGIDLKAGTPDGAGRGFAFIAPTVRKSKIDGTYQPYRWIQPPDLDALTQWGAGDRSGEKLIALLGTNGSRTNEVVPDISGFMAQRDEPSPWDDIEATLATGRNDGVMRLASSLRGTGSVRDVEIAIRLMYAEVWPRIDQDQSGHEFSIDEFEGVIRSVWQRYEDGAVTRGLATVAAANGAPGAFGVAPGTEMAPLTGVGLLDAYLVERVASECLSGSYVWARGLGWMAWDGQVWRNVDVSVPYDSVRRYFKWMHSVAISAGADVDTVKRLASLLVAGRIRNATDLCRGVAGVATEADAFDADPDLLNCTNGVVDLRTGELLGHEATRWVTKSTKVVYDPDATHPDWDAALEALPEDVRDWYQLRLGQGITGYMTPDDLLLVHHGGGANGKTSIMVGVAGALGDYYTQVSHRALLANPDTHPTELMDFRGSRIAVLEETPEERRLSVVRLKETVGTPTIKARRMRQDPVAFTATHTLLLSTNYLPAVEETDHGTWRRLACLTFPYRWLRPGVKLDKPGDRVGDTGLRERIRLGETGQHEAVLAWLVAGARRWYAGDKVMPPIPQRVERDTMAWRVEGDVLLAYVYDRCDFDPAWHVTNTELLTDLNEWLLLHGYRVWSAKLLTQRLVAHSGFGGVTQRYINPGSGQLSRRVSQHGMPAQPAPKSGYKAWQGIRFKAV